jgi:hypothetical protein
MTAQIKGARAEALSERSMLGGAICAAMASGALGIVLSVVFGAPPTTLWILGLLLLCPTGMWILCRYNRRAVQRFGWARGAKARRERDHARLVPDRREPDGLGVVEESASMYVSGSDLLAQRKPFLG